MKKIIFVCIALGLLIHLTGAQPKCIGSFGTSWSIITETGTKPVKFGSVIALVAFDSLRQLTNKECEYRDYNFSKKFERAVDRNAVQILTPPDSFCIQPSLNRVGDKVLYVTQDSFIVNPGSFNVDTRSEWSSICMLNLASKTSRRLISNDRTNMMPNWHPDGSRFLFVCRVGPVMHIFESDTIDTIIKCITDSIMPGASITWNDPSWNESGTEIICIADSFSDSAQVKTVSKIVSLDPLINKIHVWGVSKTGRFINPVYVDSNTVLVTNIYKEENDNEHSRLVYISRKGKVSKFKIPSALNDRPPDFWGACFMPSQGRYIYNGLYWRIMHGAHVKEAKKHYNLLFMGNSYMKGDTTIVYGVERAPLFYRRTWSGN
jgi:hypothetical protein